MYCGAGQLVRAYGVSRQSSDYSLRYYPGCSLPLSDTVLDMRRVRYVLLLTHEVYPNMASLLMLESPTLQA